MVTSYMVLRFSCSFFFFNDTATTEIYTLSLHDALPICKYPLETVQEMAKICAAAEAAEDPDSDAEFTDRKSTRLNSSHLVISYAVFCLKKKTQTHYQTTPRHAKCNTWRSIVSQSLAAAV